MPSDLIKTIRDHQALAHQLLDICLEVKSGERVWIHSWDHTIELASRLAWECRKRGCDTFTTIQQEDLWLRSVMEAPVESLDRLSEQMAAALGKTDVYTSTLGPGKRVPGDKIRRGGGNLFTRWFWQANSSVKAGKRLAKAGGFGSLGTEAALAT